MKRKTIFAAVLISALALALPGGMARPGIASASVSDATHECYLPLVQAYGCAGLFDPFDDPGSGWYIGNLPEITYAYLNGEYRLLSKQPYLFFLKAPTCDRQAYVVEADMRWEGSPGSKIGLLVGIESGYSAFYFVSLDTQAQQATIFLYKNRRLTPQAGPETVTAIHPGSQSNHVRVDYSPGESRMEVTINSQPARSLGFSASGYSGAGLAMQPDQSAPVVDARFDNFRVDSSD